jgi:hypothetical protein
MNPGASPPTAPRGRLAHRPNRRIHRLILSGYGLTLVGLLGLFLTTFSSYVDSGCGPTPCVVSDNALFSGGDVVALLVLASLPLLAVFDFRWDRRLLGVIGIVGAVILVWAVAFGLGVSHPSNLSSPVVWYARPALDFLAFAGLLMVGALVIGLGLRGTPRSRSAPAREGRHPSTGSR